MDFSGLGEAQTWIALASLSAMEIVLGIDNVVFIAILTSRVPVEKRARTARIGLAIALLMRVALLFGIAWIMRLTRPLFTVAGLALSGKSLILLGGGLFLVGKAVIEIHHKMEGLEEHTGERAARAGVGAVIAQIVALDLVFSLDSVITAVGMIEPERIWIMVIAIILAVIVMMVGSRPLGELVNRHPTVKVLALSFLILIGVMLVAEGLGRHIPKGYIYFAIAFAVGVEAVNLRVRAAAERRRAGARSSPSSPSPSAR
jgi:predicted tellurium resistance membrane protein TerC